MSRLCKIDFNVSVLKESVLENLQNYKQHFVINGYGRRFFPFVQIDKEYVSNVFSKFGIFEFYDEPKFGHFIGNHFLENAYTEPHTDMKGDGYSHVRCNIPLVLPEKGGNPTVNGVEFDIDEDHMWIIFASEEIHGSTPISNGERVIMSLGAYVPSNLIPELMQKYTV